MIESDDWLYELEYPYLTQLFGLSGWVVFTPIFITTDPKFMSRKPHINLKQHRRPLRIIDREGRIITEFSFDRAVKEDWNFYWNQPIYDENGDFTNKFRRALIYILSQERLWGYIFRDARLYFSSDDVVKLKPNTMNDAEKQRLENAYLKTDYVVCESQYGVTIRIGESNPCLHELLKQRQSLTWAFITAYNPFSESLSNEENELRQANLLRELKRNNFQFLEGYGQSNCGKWEAERSVFIFGIEREAAIVLARSYGQNAIIFGEGSKPELVWCF